MISFIGSQSGCKDLNLPQCGAVALLVLSHSVRARSLPGTGSETVTRCITRQVHQPNSVRKECPPLVIPHSPYSPYFNTVHTICYHHTQRHPFHHYLSNLFALTRFPALNNHWLNNLVPLNCIPVWPNHITMSNPEFPLWSPYFPYCVRYGANQLPWTLPPRLKFIPQRLHFCVP